MAETELKAFRLPHDVIAAIHERAAGVRSETAVVIEMLRFAMAGKSPKSSKREVVAAQKRKAEDPLSTVVDRNDIDYVNPDELPSGGSVASLDAVGPLASDGRGRASVENWRAGRKPLLKPSERKGK